VKPTLLFLFIFKSFQSRLNPVFLNTTVIFYITWNISYKFVKKIQEKTLFYFSKIFNILQNLLRKVFYTKYFTKKLVTISCNFFP